MNRRANLAGVVIAAVVGAGCGSAPKDPGDAGESTARKQAVTFSQCMREHGVLDFPDPDASGELTADAAANGSSVNPDGPEWRQAIQACEDLKPSGFTGRKRTAGEQDAGLAFAQCMRDNGVPDFPDPTEGDPLVDTNRIPSAATSEGMSRLNGAMETCSEFSTAAGATQP